MGIASMVVRDRCMTFDVTSHAARKSQIGRCANARHCFDLLFIHGLLLTNKIPERVMTTWSHSKPRRTSLLSR